MRPVPYALEDDIAAIATALAPSALGVIRTSGAQSIKRIACFFSRPQSLLQAAGHTMLHGWIHDKGVKVDEVVLCIYRCPKSNTGEDVVEIMCHGGVHIVKTIYALCLKNGFRPAERGEFTFRSYIHGKTDLTKAEAVKEIISSKTGLARQKAAERLSGSVFKTIETIKNDLITAIAALEVGIEYPEDEATLANSFNRTLLEKPVNTLQLLASSWQSEKIYQNGICVVLAGRTNAGKSSLFNAVLKEDRAIVSDIHGTTRDWLKAELDFQGIPITFFDTAGIRETSDTVEAIGVQRSIELIQSADIILYLVDSSRSISLEDTAFLAETNIPMLLVYTKADLIETEKQPASAVPFMYISAKTGYGIDTLIDNIVKIVINQIPQQQEIPAYLGSERQKTAVNAALEMLNHAKYAADEGFPLDAIIQDIEDSIHIIGSITGDVRSDDILDKLFSSFCVGK